MRGSSRWNSRGELWVLAQFVLLPAIVVACIVDRGDWSFLPSRIVGAGLLLAGGMLALPAFPRLGRALTPLPKPREEGRLVDDGPYRFVRHPMYGGGDLASLGLALVLASVAGLVLAATHWVLVDGKARREERWLLERYEGYAAYRRRVPHRFVPGIY